MPRAPGWPAEAGEPLFTTLLSLGASARPAAPIETRRRLAAALSDPFLWPRAPLYWLRAGRPAGLGAWDAAALLRAARGLAPEALRASRWPAPELAAPFTAWLFEGQGKGDARGIGTVSVLNAGAAPGVALKATKVLRWAGLDVVHFGNAPGPQAETGAVDFVGRPETARAALAALGCRKAETLTALEPSPMTMASVSIGRDWDSCARLTGAGRGTEEEHGTRRDP
ncbi:MAG: LytR C-terminal domain-containing protein [Elusimicrobia bacterium]|nr:LytR C-terminal domain-containing protein [Elusimicrobiota bacterium]